MLEQLKLIVFLYLYFIYIIIADELNDADYLLLCKKCGHKIGSLRNSIYVNSPLAIKTWNETCWIFFFFFLFYLIKNFSFFLSI